MLVRKVFWLAETVVNRERQLRHRAVVVATAVVHHGSNITAIIITPTAAVAVAAVAVAVKVVKNIPQ
jgi:hypothetical protein